MMPKARVVHSVLLLLAVMSLAAGGFCQTEKTPTPSEQMDKLFEFWDRLDQPGFAALVVKDGQVVYEKGFGLACLEHSVPITPKSVFNVATAAEIMTGMAAAMLETQGKWSMSDDIRKYIPEIPDFGAPVTVGNLVHHTSGLHDWQVVSRLASWDTAEITFDRVLSAVKAQKTLAFAPGSRTSYSATDYDLLAEAIRRLTGKPFQDWTYDNIFKPLKMTRTQFRDDCRSMIEDQAFSYHYPRTAYFKGADNLSVMGSHSLFISLGDLAKWFANLQSGQFGGKDLIAKMLSPAKLTTGGDTGYAYGFAVGAYNGLRQFAIVGNWASYGIVLAHFPDQKISYAVFANWDYTPVDGFLEGVADIYLSPFVKASATPLAPASSAPKPRKEVKLSPAVLGRYAGMYRLDPGTVFVMTLTAGQLVMTVPGQGERYPLIPVSETEFALSFPGFSVTFLKNKEGKFDRLSWKQYGVETIARRIEFVKPPPAELQEYAGTYVNEELGINCSVALQGERIVLTPQGQPGIMLSPQEKDRFNGNSQVFPAILFQRDAQNRLTGFVLADEKLRDFVFKRI